MPFSYLRVTIHAQGQARRRKTQRYSQINTASVSEPSAETERSETLGTSNSLVTAGTRARSGRKTAESQKPIHNFKEHRRPAPPASKLFPERHPILRIQRAGNCEMVEPIGIEPTTCSLQSYRSPN